MERADAPQGGRCLRLGLALFFILLATSAMNVTVFPSFDSVFTYARDISVSVSAVAMVAVGAIATVRPALLRMRLLNRISLCLMTVGVPALLASLHLESDALLLAVASLLAVARAWTTIVVGIALTGVATPEARRAVGAAFSAVAVCGALMWHVPVPVGFACFLIMPLAANVLSWRDARDLLMATQESQAPLDFSSTQPSTFIPLWSRFFACLFIFRVAFGFSLRFASTPLTDAVCALPALVLCAYLLLVRRGVPFDVIARLAVLLIAAGFLLGTSGGIVHPAAGNAALASGNALFDIVAWAVLINAGARNPRAALSFIAWGRGVTAAGSVVGALLGVCASTVGTALLWGLSCSLALAVVAFSLFALDGYSFEGRVSQISPVVEEAASLPQRDLNARCADIAAAFGLTPRETEVFEMLARGRDRAYIEEHLVISRNTVKAHAKHIYGKLGVHSHQELIDMVERSS